MPSELFNRYLRLNVVDGSGVGFNLGELSTRFLIRTLSNVATPSAKISIWNLRQTTISRLKTKDLRIQIDAGYDSRHGVIFDGRVTNVYPYTDGPDRITEIYAYDGVTEWRRGRVNISFPPNTSLHQIVRGIVASYGARVGSLAGLTNTIVKGQSIFSGDTKDVLRQLEEAYGFEARFEGGVVNVSDTNRPNGTGVIEVSSRTGMIRTPIASTDGVEVTSLLHPMIRPGGLVNIITAGARAQGGIDTLSAARLNLVGGGTGGTFQVLSVVHTGETRGPAWYTSMYCVRSEDVSLAP